MLKNFGSDVVGLVKNYKTLNAITGEQITKVNDYIDALNTLKDTNALTTDSITGLYNSVGSLNSDSLTYYFQSVAEGAENARVNIVDAYAAILDGNTHGLQNVQSIMNTFNNSFDGSVEKQKEFTKAVGQSNKGLANYLNSIEAGGTATLKGYAGQLVKTTAQTVGLQIATTALNAAISLGLTALITGVIALFDHFIVTLEESRKALSDLKDEYSDIKSNLESVNDELKTTIDRMNELEKKDTLTFTEKEEYDNLKKTNNELERKIALLELEQKNKNKEINQAFVSTMQKDVDKVGEYSKLDGTPTTEKEYIDWQLELRQKHYQSLIEAEQSYNNTKSNVEKKILENDIEYYQGLIDNIDDYLFRKNQLWTADSEDIEYISNPTTDDEKAVNEWLDFINDFQDKMAIAMGDTNAKTNAFNRLMDNWQFDGLVQSLQDLGEQGQVTAEMLDDPKYDAFIQKLVLLGIIDSADNLDLIALAFNNLDTSADNASDTTDITTNSIYNLVAASDDLQKSLDDTFSNQSTLQSAFDKIQEGSSLSADEVRKLIELCPQLATEFVKTADGYTIGADKLINANDEIVQSTKQSLQERADYLKEFINTDYDTSGIDSSYEAKKYNEWQQSVKSAKTELEGLELILSMFGITLEDTGDKLEDLSKITSNKVKLITTAMEEMNDTGYISSSTYAEIVEMGGNFADCLEIQNGKLKLNVEKLKELERQEILNAIAAKNLAISELNVSAAMAGQARDAEKVEEIRKQITALEEERAVLWQINDEIANAKPNESGSGGSSSSADPWKEQFDKEYSEKQHLLAMEQLSEEDYLDWLDGAYKQYFSDLTKYQDEYYKYEEEVYKGRKQLAEDFYDEQQKLFEDRVSNLETNIEVATKYSTDADGNKLNIEEKYDYISSAYQEIINEINARIGEILDAGIEGHEEEVAKLEKQIEEYQEKLAEVPKDAAKEEQDYIKKLKEDYSDLYDENIDKIKKQQKAAEEAAQAEIDAVQDKIDALKEANEKAEEANEIEKARQELANASQRTRQVYGADGSISFQVDQDKVKEAQEKLDKLLQEQQINILEEQKQTLEDAKNKASESYDRIIENLETEKENGEKRFDILLDVLDRYLNPDNGESNSDVWKTLAHIEGAKYEDGTWKDKDGNVIDIDKLINSVETAKNEDKQTDTDNKDKDNPKDDTVISGTLTRQDIGDEEPNVKDKTESAIDTFFSNLEKKLNMPSGSINLENAMQVFRNSPMMNFNPYGAMNDITGLANKEYVNNVNNQQNITPTFTGDININNPVGNSDDLAKELMMNIPIAFQKQMYSNLK